MVKLVNMVLADAIRRGASDLHWEPYEKEFRIRFRIDGVLHEMLSPPKRLEAAIISRLKIMANLDIAERRLPQDGRIKLRYGRREIDFRVSILPTIFGEKAVLRILDKESLQLDLACSASTRGASRSSASAIHQPYGMVLITGPDRLRQDDDAVLGHPHDQLAGPQHHDGRGPGRVQPARASTRSRSTTASAARSPAVLRSLPAAGPRRDPGRRDARPRDRPDLASGPRSPATSSSRRCTPTTAPRRSRGSSTWASRRSCCPRRCS